MHGTFDVATKTKRSHDWSMIVLIGLCIVYAGCIGGMIVADAGMIQ